jgi:hypothetical protein
LLSDIRAALTSGGGASSGAPSVNSTAVATAEVKKSKKSKVAKSDAAYMTSMADFANAIKDIDADKLEKFDLFLGSVIEKVKSVEAGDPAKIHELAKSFRMLSGVMAIAGPIIDYTMMRLGASFHLPTMIRRLGTSLLQFAASLLGASMIMGMVDYVAIADGVIIIVGMSMAFAAIGKAKKWIYDGTTSVYRMVGTLPLFSLAMFTMSWLMFIPLTDSLKVPLIMGAMATAFALIGKFGKHITKGSFTILGMGLGMALFGVAMLSVMWIADIDFMSILKVPAMMMAVGGTFALLGLLAGNIMIGSLTVGVMAIGLGLFGLAVMPALAMTQVDVLDLMKIPLMIGVVGAAVALLGAAAPVILPGSLALAAMSVGLFVFATAIKKLTDIPSLNEESAKGLGNTIRAVIGGVIGGISAISYADVLQLPLKIGTVLMMSAALGALGTGLGTYQRNNPTWTVEDAKTLEYSIASMSTAFAIAGGSAGAVKVLGFPITRSDLERGVDVSGKMGKALIDVSMGIKSWERLKMDGNRMETVANAIGQVLNIIPASFASIGARERGTKQDIDLWGIKIPSLFDRGDVTRGIKSTKDLGSTLLDLYNGIRGWQKMDVSPKEVQEISDNISRVLNTIPAVFASLAARDRGSGGTISYYGLQFTNPFSAGDIEYGIAAVTGLGEVLYHLYQGVNAWSPDGENGMTPEKIKGISRNIDDFLIMIPESFAKVGRMEFGAKSLITGMGDIKRGTALMTDLVPLIQNISDIIIQVSKAEADPEILSNMGMEMNSIVSYLVGDVKTGIKLRMIISPFAKFVDSFGKFVEHSVKYMDAIDGSDPRKVSKNIEWVKTLKSIGELNPRTVVGNLDAYSKAYKTGFLVGESGPAKSQGFFKRFMTEERGTGVFNKNREGKSEASGGTSRALLKPDGTKATDADEKYTQIIEMHQEMMTQMMGQMETMSMHLQDISDHITSGIVKTREVDGSKLFGG